MNSLIKKIMSPFIKKEIPKPLGRWTLNNKTFLKADYANIDSCGDNLCGKPDTLKKLQIIPKYTSCKSNNTVN
jgi:hypothetical protein